MQEFSGEIVRGTVETTAFGRLVTDSNETPESMTKVREEASHQIPRHAARQIARSRQEPPEQLRW